MKLAYWVDGEVRPEERLSSAISASDRASSSNWKERVIVHVLYLEKRGNSPILPQTIWCLIPATDKEHCTCQVEKKNLLIRPLIHSLNHWLTHITHPLTHPNILHVLYISLLGWRKNHFGDLSDHCVTITFTYVHTTLHSPINQWTNRYMYLTLPPTRSFYRRKEKEQNEEKICSKKVRSELSSFFLHQFLPRDSFPRLLSTHVFSRETADFYKIQLL